MNNIKIKVSIFEKLCLYDSISDETRLFGHFSHRFSEVIVENKKCEVVFANIAPDFYIKINGKINNVESIFFIMTTLETDDVIEEENVIFTNVQLLFPFDSCDLQLTSTSAIITTMRKDYSHRLDEWIKYNLKLGFSGIVIFNNDGNLINNIDESLENCVRSVSTEDVCNKYKGKVCLVDAPYSNQLGGHWSCLQRVFLNIGIHAFREKCRSVALIDADEFIYFPKDPSTNVEKFLMNYSTIRIGSNILTNKNRDDVLDNNILTLARYIGEDKYTKVILHTDKFAKVDFICSPHEHWSQESMYKEDILHYHCWMNTRYWYNEFMQTVDLSNF